MFHVLPTRHTRDLPWQRVCEIHRCSNHPDEPLQGLQIRRPQDCDV